MSTDILLTTINARFSHASLGLRCLYANLGELRERAAIREFQIQQPAAQIAEALLAETPRLIGFGIYVWNVSLITEVIRIVKAVRPQTVIVIGGPEVSHEQEQSEAYALCDYLIPGEADLAFAELVRRLLSGGGGATDEGKVIHPGLPDLGGLQYPYACYMDEDIAHRIIYIEASRGCPFQCEFCLSSLDESVRTFPLESFLDEAGRLLERGVHHFKFVDRTFNLDQRRARPILEFFLEHWREGMGLHFEIVPDRLPAEMLELMTRFPAGGLHLEAGIQTFNPTVQEAISRRQDLAKTLANLRYLREKTAAWIHADLIAGLPGESLESFAAGFDQLLALRPQTIQVGILKRLRGAPIARHTAAHRMVYSEQPPYEILQNDLIDFSLMQQLKRFARYFDLYYNSGNFPRSLELLWAMRDSPFAAFMELADAVWNTTGRTHEISLAKLMQILHDVLAKAGTTDLAVVQETLNTDFHRNPGRKEKLEFLNCSNCGSNR